MKQFETKRLKSDEIVIKSPEHSIGTETVQMWCQQLHILFLYLVIINDSYFSVEEQRQKHSKWMAIHQAGSKHFLLPKVGPLYHNCIYHTINTSHEH